MEITAQRISTININLVQDEEEGVDDIAPFIQSLPKLQKLINAKGYTNGFTKEERIFWNSIIDTFIHKEEGKPVITPHNSNIVEVSDEST